ncbi:MAG: hypothetical protein Tsb005_08630 [Gammaproteobacteria bacterium]
MSINDNYSGFTHELTDMYKSMRKPMMDFMELNLDMFSKMTKTANTVDAMFTANNVDELMKAQNQYLSNMNTLMTDYVQDTFKIISNSSVDVSKHLTGFTSHMMKNAQEVADNTMNNHNHNRNKDK